MRPSDSAWLQRLCLLAAGFLFLSSTCRGADPASLPKPTGYVSDVAGVVSPDDREKLEALCTRVESELGVQIALVTVDTTGDIPIRDFALNVSRRWGVGDKRSNQGVLLLLAIKDHKSDIETGRGIEPYLTDGFSGGTLRSMRTQLRDGQYGAALFSAVQEMAGQIAQGKNLPFALDNATTPPDLGPREERREPSRTRRGQGGGGFPIFILIVFALLWLLSRGGRRGGGMRGGGGGGGFLTGMLLGNLLSNGRRSGGGWGGGDWGSSGGFGGGDSGGGGGFGGFGGGDFGGGGASSDW